MTESLTEENSVLCFRERMQVARKHMLHQCFDVVDNDAAR
jgi:hypothetical protein